MHEALAILKSELEGDLFTDHIQRVLYSTDASQYKELPLAVTRPKSREDIKKIISFARKHQQSIIPRGAGTSLAGQVVGPGIVVDISKYMNKIVEINPKERYAIVEPGVVLAELNKALLPYGLQFGPETSTANRCVLGGMLGNNSCGLHSLVYGSVREHILEADVILSDSSETKFKALSEKEFHEKLNDNSNPLEKQIYNNLYKILSNEENQKEIRDNFPHPEVTRRNMGYAIDILLNSNIFTKEGEQFNICKLLAGSEGTLAFTVKLKLNLIPLPPQNKGLICAHFNNLEEALEGNLIALQYKPDAVELMDDIIMQCTKENIEQRKNRFFIEGDPGAMLMIEFSCDSADELQDRADQVIDALKKADLGYHYPLITGDGNIKKVWALRTAGLGLLANIPGDKKGVPGIEDTAVAPRFLPQYVAELKIVLEKLNLSSVFYAHVATGEIHFRPLINFKDPSDVILFEKLMKEVAILVKKYRGSMSGEHGDGRVRGKFIPFMLGEKNYLLLKSIKKCWDPENIMNPGKITDTPPITENLRVIPGKPNPKHKTLFDFSKNRGYVRSIEKCNGSGDCRKSEIIGGSMCPTFMATRDEDKSTRGRANLLFNYFYNSNEENPFSHKELYEILDLCISCKACKAECPSNVDMTKLKAEFLQHYYDIHRIPIRTLMIAYLPLLYKLAMPFRSIANKLMNQNQFKNMLGITKHRNLPPLSKVSLKKWTNRNNLQTLENRGKRVYLFNDEFTNYNDSDLGIKVILLLTQLGYEVKIPTHKESGRTFLSKGLVRTAKKIAVKNVSLLKDLVSESTPLIGIEPSAILTFRDEYPELVDENLRDEAKKLAKNTYLLEEFLADEIDKGAVTSSSFTSDFNHILLHGHCHQKAIASTKPTMKILTLPKNFSVAEIPSGCCGMAGSFGYEKEHYDLSVKIGEMVLFPAVKSATAETVISAPGTSCRHHIHDNTGRKALHPAEILFDALLRKPEKQP